MKPESYPLFGAVAVANGILSDDELAAVLEQAEERGLPVGQIMFKLGYVSRDRLLELLAEQYRTTIYDLDDWRPTAALLDALPADVVQDLRVIPIQCTKDRLVVAASGPFTTPVLDMLQQLADMTNRGVGMVICDEEGLRRLIAEHFTDDREWDEAEQEATDALDDFSTLLGEVKAEAAAGKGAQGGATAGAELEDLVDEASARAMQLRAHPFGVVVQRHIDVAVDLTNKAKQYQHMGLFSEGIALATRARDQLNAAVERADDVERQWGPLLRHVEVLRSRFAQLDAEGAADFAPQEIGRARAIRDELSDAIDAKDVTRVRELVDEGQLLVERIAALSPRHNRRERLVENLTHVRDVLSRARRLGAQSIAPAAVEAAYRLLDAADAQARESAWDQVEDSLAQALAHAEAAEREALEYAEKRQTAVAELSTLCDEVEATTTSLFNHASVSSILSDLIAARADMSRARVAMDNEEELTPHIGTLRRWAEERLPELREKGDAAGRSWEEVGSELQEIVEMTRDAAPAAIDPDQADVVQRLADRVGTLFRLLAERNLSDARAVIQVTRDELRDFWDLRERATQEREQAEGRLLQLSTDLAALAGHPDAPACRELIDRIQNDLDLASTTLTAGNYGDAASLLDSAEAAIQDELRSALTARQEEAAALLDRACRLAPRLAELAKGEAASAAPSELLGIASALERAVHAAVARDSAAAEAALQDAESREATAGRMAQSARSARRKQLNEQLAATEKLLQEAVDACTGFAAPDMLEDAYFELNSARTALEEDDESLDVATTGAIEGRLRVAAQTAKMLTSSGGQDALKFGQALETLESRLQSIDQTIGALRGEPTWGLNTAPLDEAMECAAEARSALDQGDVDTCYEHVRMADRAIESWRITRRAAESARPDYEAFFETLPDRLSHLDVSLLPEEALEPLDELRQLPGVAAAALESSDLETLREVYERAERLWAVCAEAERSQRSRRLVDMHEARAVAYHAVRLAELVGAKQLSPDLFHAASELLNAAEGDVEKRKWDQAQVQFAAAADRAALAQEAALRTAREAWLAQADLTNAAFAHLDRGDVEAARKALDAAALSATRAQPPLTFPQGASPSSDGGAGDRPEGKERDASSGPSMSAIQWESAEAARANEADVGSAAADARMSDEA